MVIPEEPQKFRVLCEKIDQVNINIGKIRSHPWAEFLIASGDRDFGKAPKILCSTHPKLVEKYSELAEEFGSMLAELEWLIGIRSCKLRNEIDWVDAPPLFLRSISGTIFAPAREGWIESQTNSCGNIAKVWKVPNKTD